jgi:SAM-dependent MidA family methyltransferase
MAVRREFLDLIAAEAAAAGGAVSFARFMELALYHPQLGYYTSAKLRVGLSPAADFFTAASAGPVFGTLVAAAAAACLRAAGRDAGAHSFVEIGAEPGTSVLAGVEHPFAAVRTVRLGDPPAAALHRACVVFSNELFDAQPCRRFVRRAGQWRETGVAVDGDLLVETLLPGRAQAAAPLPEEAPDGYRLDWSEAAEDLGTQLAAAPWTGLFLACDYGKTWEEIAFHTPGGTVRAYQRHQQHGNLLDEPGERDLTAHVCWDRLAAVLAAAGFTPAVPVSQEAFFLRHARDSIERIVTRASRNPDPDRARLHQLLHPALQGQRFQVLACLR